MVLIRLATVVLVDLWAMAAGADMAAASLIEATAVAGEASMGSTALMDSILIIVINIMDVILHKIS